MKILGYVLSIIGLGFLISSGKVWHWGKDGMPIWKHILFEVIGTILVVIGVGLIKEL